MRYTRLRMVRTALQARRVQERRPRRPPAAVLQPAGGMLTRQAAFDAQSPQGGTDLLLGFDHFELGGLGARRRAV